MSTTRPFVFGVAATDEHFTDREEETRRLLANFRHGINTILISPRRWGKTSLVRRVGRLAESASLKVVYIDIFSCRSETQFYNTFAEAVVRQTSTRWEELADTAKRFLSTLRPRITLGTGEGAEFSLSLDFRNNQDCTREVLELPQRIAKARGIRMVVCIDEFQQIAEIPDSKHFQRLLRGAWQLQTDVSYCLYGSKKHLMNELFEDKSQPFYKFGDVIFLPKIDTEHWVEYISRQFEDTGKHISSELAREICRLADNHSSYVQQLAWLTWVHTDGTSTQADIDDARQTLLQQNSPLFEKQTENLSAYQLNYLRYLLAKPDSNACSAETIKTFGLGSSANVSTIRKALVKKEIIDLDKGTVYIPDPALALWLKERL